MSTSTFEILDEEDWDVEESRGDHESDEHWELRRNFLTKNKGRFPKLRLLSLSQVFANVEFLGCRYPDETMDLVVELSAGIVEDYRKAREGRLQRTFVKASDAAEKKSKGTKRHFNSVFQSNSSASPVVEHKVFIRESAPSSPVPTPPPSATTISTGLLTSDQYEEALNGYASDLRGLVIVEQVFQQNEGPLQIINRSCGMSHKALDVKYAQNVDGSSVCRIKIGETFVVEGRGFNKETARQEAATQTMTILRQLCYTIEEKANVVSATEFGKTDINGLHKAAASSEQQKISEDNKGSKLLKLMGWQGGGLGKDQQGIQAPIGASSEVVARSRLGLGAAPQQEAQFARAVNKFLKNQMWQCHQFDLKFSSEFSSDERKIIHQIAGAFGLKSRSHGKGDTRFLAVSRKIQPENLVRELLELGESPKYRVIPPQLLATTCNRRQS